MTTIQYVRMDPFNVASSDQKTKTIYIDHKIKGTDVEPDLIEHEEFHLNNSGNFSEPFDEKNIILFFKTLRHKPLMMFQIIFPFVIFKDNNGKTTLQWDPLSLFCLAIFMAAILGALSIYTIQCQHFDLGNLTVKTICQRCNPFLGCVSYTV